MQGESSKNALVHFYCRTAAYCALRKSKRLKISYDRKKVLPVYDLTVNDTLYKIKPNRIYSADSLIKRFFDVDAGIYRNIAEAGEEFNVLRFLFVEA